MGSIDWYLNRPYFNLISWDMDDLLLLCDVYKIGSFDFQNYGVWTLTFLSWGGFIFVKIVYNLFILTFFLV